MPPRLSPLQNTILLGALILSKIEIIVIFIKMFYYLGIRLANFWIECRQTTEKLEIASGVVPPPCQIFAGGSIAAVGSGMHSD